jgi:hypothetical protein
VDRALRAIGLVEIYDVQKWRSNQAQLRHSEHVSEQPLSLARKIEAVTRLAEEDPMRRNSEPELAPFDLRTFAAFLLSADAAVNARIRANRRGGRADSTLGHASLKTGARRLP